MIIEALMNGLYNLLDLLLMFEIPSLPAEVYSYVSQLFDYMVAGAGLLANYVPLAYLLVLFGILLFVDGAILVYHLVIWIIKKIPILGME